MAGGIAIHKFINNILKTKSDQQIYSSEPPGEHHYISGAPGLMDRVFAIHAGSLGFDFHRRHMSEQFFQSSRPGYLHPMCSELENSGIRKMVGDCSVTERWRWHPPYQTGKTVHVQANILQT